MFVCLSGSLSVCVSVCRSVSLSVWPRVLRNSCLSVFLSVRPSVCLTTSLQFDRSMKFSDCLSCLCMKQPFTMHAFIHSFGTVAVTRFCLTRHIWSVKALSTCSCFCVLIHTSLFIIKTDNYDASAYHLMYATMEITALVTDLLLFLSRLQAQCSRSAW